MRPMPRCLIALGANLGNRERTLQRATELLAQRVGEIAAVSDWFSTHAVGGPSDQPEFLNAAALCETELPPAEVLARLHQVETELGRRRSERWEARTLDLDLLLYEDQVADTRQLQLPHPRMAFRKFVLQPAAQIAPHLVHPPTQYTLNELLSRLDVRPLHVVILGERAAEAAGAIAEQTGGGRLERTSLGGTMSPDAEQPIDLLARGVAAWKKAKDASPQLVVSDYWIDEWVSHEIEEAAALKLLDQQDRAWRWPHLVLYAEPSEQVGTRPEISAGPASSWSVTAVGGTEPQEFAGGWVSLYRPRQFPVIRLRGAGVAAVVTEALAAIEAMV